MRATEIVVRIIGGDVYVHHNGEQPMPVTVYNYDAADALHYDDEILATVYAKYEEGEEFMSWYHDEWRDYLHERGVQDEYDLNFEQGGYDEDE